MVKNGDSLKRMATRVIRKGRKAGGASDVLGFREIAEDEAWAPVDGKVAFLGGAYGSYRTGDVLAMPLRVEYWDLDEDEANDAEEW